MDSQLPSTPKYVHTRANELYQELHAFVLQSRPGTPLASENALARKYHVARMTTHKVLQRLEEENLVERRQGVGTFVKGKRIVTMLLPCPEYLEEPYQPLNEDLILQFQGAMKAAMERGMRLETLPVASVNNPDFNLNIIDYEQFSDIGSDSLIVCCPYFCKLYQLFSSRRAKVAIISSQYEHYGYRNYRNEFYTIDADKRGTIRQILDYCHAKGKRRIALAKGNVAEKKYPLNNAYSKWCQEHGMPELFFSFPKENSQSDAFSKGIIADLYEKTQFDALIFQHNGFWNVSGTIQAVLELPPEMLVFGVDFKRYYSPNLAPFPCFTENCFRLGYEAVKILAEAPPQGAVRVFPYEFHALPKDWEECLKASQ